MSLLGFSLIAGGMLSWQQAQAGDSFAAEVNTRLHADLPSSPVGTDGTRPTVGPGTDSGSLAMCENEGPSLVDSRAKAVYRVLQLARASLRRTTSQLPPVLLARNFSVSLLLRNVLLQI